MITTRRRFAASAAALPFTWRALAQPGTAPPRWVFLGTDKGAGIFRCAWNGATGTLGEPQLVATTDRPDFFSLHPLLPVLYTVNEATGIKAGVSAYRTDAATGMLTLLNRRETHGDNPCFVSIDRTGHAAYAANYTGGSLTAFKLAPDGSLAQTVGVLAYNQPQHGPVSDRQDAAHLHCATLSPDNRFVISCDLGDDVLLVFPVAPEADASIQTPLRFPTRPGAGPRHVAFHPNGQWLYCMNELDGTVALYDWRVQGGTPSLIPRPDGIASAFAPGAPAGSTGCELVMSDDGRFLTTCTRGENQIQQFRIHPQTGLLTEQQRLSCGGQIPRLIAFDPSRRWLLSMNQGSSNVAVFAYDASSGRLSPKPRSFAADSPMCVAWV